jgi:hypothetical protein
MDFFQQKAVNAMEALTPVLSGDMAALGYIASAWGASSFASEDIQQGLRGGYVLPMPREIETVTNSKTGEKT